MIALVVLGWIVLLGMGVGVLIALSLWISVVWHRLTGKYL